MIPEIIYKHSLDTQIQIAISDTSSRKQDPLLEKQLTQDWEKHMQTCIARGEKVWDGTSYRVNSIEIDTSVVRIELGPIKWSVRSPIRFIELLHEKGPAYRGQGAFVSALLQTSDGMFVFGKRPNGTLTTIGGLVSGEETQIETFEDFDTMQNIELMEEIGINSTYVRNRTFLGMVYSSAADVGFIYMLSLSIDKNNVEQAFKDRTDEEISSLLFLTTEELETHLGQMGDYWQLLPTFIKK